MKMSPSTKTAASATCHGTPSVNTTVNVKKAFSPSPGARPNGRLAYNAITRMATTAARMVTTVSISTTCA